VTGLGRLCHISSAHHRLRRSGIVSNAVNHASNWHLRHPFDHGQSGIRRRPGFHTMGSG